MITMSSSFAAREVLEIQTLGVGMAVAVAVDPSSVRGIMVPALMRLLGRANCRGPTTLPGRIARLGLYEQESMAEVPVAG
jgi:RND superfamily putative drug exporter